MALVREDRRFDEGNAVRAYEVQKIEVLNDETPSTPNGSKRANGYVHVAKLLKDFEKRHDNGKNILDESEKADEKLLKQGENSETANDFDGIMCVQKVSYIKDSVGEDGDIL